MDELDLLQRMRMDVDPMTAEERARVRSILDARIVSPDGGAPSRSGRTLTWTRKRARRIGIIAIAAVLAGAAAASALTDHLWTNAEPIAIPIGSVDPQNPVFAPDIPHADDAVSFNDFPTTISEFAPSIRLPEGGSFDEWTTYVQSYWPRLSGLENNRAAVVGSMAFVAQCQWTQQWLTATAASDDEAAAQAMHVLPGIYDWMRTSSMVAGLGGDDPVVDWMRQGDVAKVQLAEDGCPFTGSWGQTVGMQDAKAKGDLVPAIAAARAFLQDGADPADFDWHAADSVDPQVNWTDRATQPAPVFPGDVYIAPTTEDGVMLIAVSESGTRFCAVISATSVEHGTVDPDRFPPDATSTNTPFDAYPGPVACTGDATPQP